VGTQRLWVLVSVTATCLVEQIRETATKDAFHSRAGLKFFKAAADVISVAVAAAARVLSVRPRFPNFNRYRVVFVRRSVGTEGGVGVGPLMMSLVTLLPRELDLLASRRPSYNVWKETLMTSLCGFREVAGKMKILIAVAMSMLGF